jgi:predicted secreted protein
MSKRLAVVWVLFVLAALAASAGDVAQFVNLGFSRDARYFMFGQFGIAQKDSTAWADTFIVDVPANSFVSKGTKKIVGAQPVDPGANGLGALLIALSDGLSRTNQLRIDHLSTGRLLYVLLDGAQAADALEFRDFQSGRSYKIVMTQTAGAGGAGASFVISIAVTEKDGSSRLFNAGDPSFTRKGVKGYNIKQIILAPDGASLVFIVQKEEQDTTGNNIRYMVETARPK